MSGQNTKSSYELMLEEPRYLCRPWIPIMKSMEAENLKKIDLEEPVLDLCCGDGIFTKCCFRKIIDVGVDIDLYFISEAQKRDVYRSILLADAACLPFKNDIFSTILSICALEHIEELPRVLLEINRILKMNQKLIFTVPSVMFGDMLFASTLLRFFGLSKLAEKYAQSKNRRSKHINIMPISDWEKMLDKFGFDIQSYFYVAPHSVVLLFSFMTSIIFKSLFLPFRIVRKFEIEAINGFLRFSFRKMLLKWLMKRSLPQKNQGGYLVIVANKVKSCEYLTI